MATSVNVDAYIGLFYALLFFFCCAVVFYYAEPGFPWHSYITIVIGYYCSFGILLLVPIDIAACVTDRRIDNYDDALSSYNGHSSVLSSAYNVFFTLILLMGSVILSYEEYYNTDGYFTVANKVMNSFKRMFIDLFAMLVAGLIVLGILMGQHVVEGIGALKLAAVIVTNGVYEFVLMFFLSYGLIEFPRDLWNRSNLKYSLLVVQRKATQDYKEISDFKINIQEDISKVKYFKDQIGKGSKNQDLLHAIDVLEKDCPKEFRSERKCKPEEVKKYVTKAGQVTLAGLAKLRGDLNISKDRYKMAQARVLTTEQTAYFFEDLVAAQQQGGPIINWSLKNEESTPQEYEYHVVIKPLLLKVAAIICGVLSLFSLLGVVCSMQGVTNSGSVYFLATHSTFATSGGIVVFILLTMGYTTYVVLWSIFQMRVAGYVELVPYRTSPESLSFNVRMCLRLAAPLAFFYLGWISENGLKNGDWTQISTQTINLVNETFFHPYGNMSISIPVTPGFNMTNGTFTNSTVPETTITSHPMLSAFSRFYNIQAVPAVLHLYGTGFPIILFILMPLFVFNIFNRVFVLLKLPQYQFGTPIPTDEELREGQRQLTKYKKIAERAEQRNALKTNLLNFAKQRNDINGKSGGLFASIFRPNSADRNDFAAATTVVLKEPDGLSGDLEKKGGVASTSASRMTGGSSWTSVYGEVCKPGKLYLFKDKKTAQSAFMSARDNSDTSESILEKVAVNVISLMDISAFQVPEKKNESAQLDLVLPTEVVKLRFKTSEDMQHWKGLLQEWKDYAHDFEMQGGDGVGDIESNTGSRNQSTSSAGGAGSNTTLAKTSTGNSSVKFAPKDNIKRSQLDQNLYDLDNIVVEDDPDLVKKKSGSFFSRISSFGTKNADANADAETAAAATTTLVSDKPAPLEGWLEKKGKGRSSDWQKRYCRIDERTASLTYSKSKSKDTEPAGTIDMRQVISVTVSAKSGKDDFGRFDVDTGERVYKFKAKTKQEAENWVEQLEAWREYFLLHMDI